MTVGVGFALAFVFLAGIALGAVAYRRRSARAVIGALAQAGLSASRVPTSPFDSLPRLVHELEAARDEAEAARDRLTLVLDGFPQAVVLFDADGEASYANGPGKRLLGGRHGEALVMAAVRELLATVGTPATRSATRRVELVGPPKQSFDAVVRSLEGGQHLVVVEDISERRRLEEVRRDFVANISHELKTPIGAMSLLAETMAAEDDPELLVRLANRLHREALRVGDTIDDLLLLSRIEADDQPVREKVDIASVLADVVERVGQAAADRRIELEIALPDRSDGTYLTVEADRRQLGSAVFNLVDNAIKYSDEGSTITIRATRMGEMAEIEVADRGMGIPARDLERIFERFYRVDRARSRLTGGTGLGLAIVRHVAQNHGGQVRVRSREGEGSAFTLSLPLAPVPVPPLARTADDDLVNPRRALQKEGGGS